MDETVLFPSPNWFQVSGLALSNDGWLVYGGPSKSLCVLKPVPADANGVVEGAEQYTARVLNRAHPDKIVSVDISPEWPEKKLVLTGSASGSVKQWSLEDANGGIKFISNLSHDIHTHEKEEIVGVAYSNEVNAVTVGSFGNIVKWDLNANVVKTFNNMLKTFKPTCMACSHHITLNVAIGTKQGVLFVVDLSGAGSLIYKVRSQDDEIMNVSWCPQYEVQVEKSVDESQRTGIVTEKPSKSKSKKGAAQKEPQKSSASDRMERIRQQQDLEVKNTSGIKKDLPQDSFEDFVVVPEDDMFDIYKDHEADEFGHKKYEPEDILVKIKEPKEQNDYLAECLKLKDAILKKNNEPEPSIESLVEALEKSDINSESGVKGELPSGSKVISESSQEETSCSREEQEESCSVSSVHMHKHLLATIGKHGGVRIWSKTGKLVASCALTAGKQQQGRFRNSWATLAWCQPELLLIADGKNQVLECNPLKPDCKNKLVTKLVHTLHKRGLHCVATNAWRANTATPVAWSVSQDRSLVRYSLCDRSTTVYNTCGGFVYNVQYCPYDVSKVAVSVGDGAVRVWTAEEAEEAEGKLSAGRVVTYWQHVQGKVLTVAWHPSRENLLAFGTAESRVGLIEAGGVERPARALGAGPAGGVYALGWGARRLYAAARQELRAYCPERPDEPGTPVPVSVEGAEWGVSAVRVRDGLMCVGSDAGGVAVLHEHGARLLAATFVGSKMIHTIEWHPQQTSFSNEESKHKNLIAVCSQDKANSVFILEYVNKEENHPKLVEYKRLTGHTNTVLQVAWSPHHEMKLLSTSHDGTVRVWDVEAGTCVSIFGGHGGTALGAAWVAQPSLPHHVLSGGADCCLRLWDARQHPAEAYRGMSCILDTTLPPAPRAVGRGRLLPAAVGRAPTPRRGLPRYVVHTRHNPPSRTTCCRAGPTAACGCGTRANTPPRPTEVCRAYSTQPSLPHHVLSGGADCCLRLWDARQHPAEAYRGMSCILDTTLPPAPRAVGRGRLLPAAVGRAPTPRRGLPRYVVHTRHNPPSRTTCCRAGPTAACGCGTRANTPPRPTEVCRAYSTQPSLPHHVLSGGADCCLRLWDARQHPAEAYRETKEEAPKKDKKKRKDKKEIKTEAIEDTETAESEKNGLAATLESKVKISKKFLLPTITKQMQKPKAKGAKRMLHKFMVKRNLETAVEETEEYDLDYTKIFGNSKEVNEVFDMEMEHHLRVGNTESWLVLCVLRGHIDAALRLAAERDLLCPYLLSLAPGVSSKYWKDASKSYLAQIDRLVANGEEDKLVVNRNYGGPVYRKVLTLLSLQDIIGAVKTLVENKLYKEAYLLCRIRYMDTIGDEVLESWVKNCLHSGVFDMAAVCHLALGNLLEAATCLSKCSDADSLRLAAELARAAGQTILADNLIGTCHKCLDTDSLRLAAELARAAGQTILADNLIGTCHKCLDTDSLRLAAELARAAGQTILADNLIGTCHKCLDTDSLRLAAELARAAGQTILADNLIGTCHKCLDTDSLRLAAELARAAGQTILADNLIGTCHKCLDTDSLRLAAELARAAGQTILADNLIGTCHKCLDTDSLRLAAELARAAGQTILADNLIGTCHKCLDTDSLRLAAELARAAGQTILADNLIGTCHKCLDTDSLRLAAELARAAGQTILADNLIGTCHKCLDTDSLRLAAELARAAGQTILADNLIGTCHKCLDTDSLRLAAELARAAGQTILADNLIGTCHKCLDTDSLRLAAELARAAGQTILADNLIGTCHKCLDTDSLRLAAELARAAGQTILADNLIGTCHKCLDTDSLRLAAELARAAGQTILADNLIGTCHKCLDTDSLRLAAELARAAGQTILADNLIGTCHKCLDTDSLRLAAELARAAGQTILADNLIGTCHKCLDTDSLRLAAELARAAGQTILADNLIGTCHKCLDTDSLRLAAELARAAGQTILADNLIGTCHKCLDTDSLRLAAELARAAGQTILADNLIGTCHKCLDTDSLRLAAELARAAGQTILADNLIGTCHKCLDTDSLRLAAELARAAGQTILADNLIGTCHKCLDTDSLRLAAELARAAGQTILADNLIGTCHKCLDTDSLRLAAELARAAGQTILADNLIGTCHKCLDTDSLRLAAELARAAGQTILADNLIGTCHKCLDTDSLRLAAELARAAGQTILADNLIGTCHKCLDTDSLRLAAELARAAGQTILADNLIGTCHKCLDTDSLRLAAELARAAGQTILADNLIGTCHKCLDTDSLRLAAELARAAGQTILADNLIGTCHKCLDTDSLRLAAELARAAGQTILADNLIGTCHKCLDTDSLRLAAELARAAGQTILADNLIGTCHKCLDTDSLRLAAELARAAGQTILADNLIACASPPS
ncbi:uncharacterized protein LOC134741723 [Cydia strobilella]|uniref:uncharacterized protein LOC134741723 n=1 Tax=Cydia strobilella TaxID=1100964 RepID=UPI0030073EA4